MAKDPAGKVEQPEAKRDHDALIGMLNHRDPAVGEEAARALERLLDDPKAADDRRRWTDKEWAKRVAQVHRQEGRVSFDLGSLAARFEDGEREHLERRRRVTEMWERWDCPPEHSGRRKWFIKHGAYAALLIGDERVEAVSTVATGLMLTSGAIEYSPLTEVPRTVDLTTVVTDKRLAADGSYRGGKGQMAPTFFVSGSAPWEAIEVERVTADDGTSAMKLSWEPESGLGLGVCGIVVDVPTGLPGASREELLRALAVHLPAVAAHAPDYESTTLTCVGCGKRWLVVGRPVPTEGLGFTELGKAIGHLCRNCGAFFCMKEKKKLGGKLADRFAKLTCSQCGTESAFPLIYAKGKRLK